MIKKTKKGFTIVELVIVIGVIGILSAILIPTFIGVTENANRARTKSELANAYAMYAADAADGFYNKEDPEGTESTDKELEFLAQEKVALAKSAGAASDAAVFYVYTTENGWATKAASVTGGTTALNWEISTPASSGQVEYGGYYFYKINA